MASAIRKEVVLRGYRPSEFVVFAFGGGGPTHVAGYMDEIPRAVIFPFSPVFCAYGSSIMDVVHVYERSHRMILIESASERPTDDYAGFNTIVEHLVNEARREVVAEGFDPENGVVRARARHALRRPDPLQAHVDAAALPRERGGCAPPLRPLRAGVLEAFSPLIVNKPGGVYIDTFVLKVAIPGQRLQLEPIASNGRGTPAPKGTREAWWPDAGGFEETPVLDLEPLLRSRGHARRARRSSSPPTRPSSCRPGSASRSTSSASASSSRSAREARCPFRPQKRSWRCSGCRAADAGRAARALETLAPGDYEIGFQRTNDIVDEALELFERSSPLEHGHRRAT